MWTVVDEIIIVRETTTVDLLIGALKKKEAKK
jgi:hypothetical protein